MIVIVAAVAKNGVIGRANRLPWHLPEDLAHFKALTMGHTVIMGRKTWESLPPRFRPLPHRRNIVVSRTPAYQAQGALVCASLDEALKVGAGSTATGAPAVAETAPAAAETGAPSAAAAFPLAGAGDLFIIGGATLYAEALPRAERLELTEIDADVAGDTFFPAFDRTQWRELARTCGIAANGLRYAFVTYGRTQST